MSENKIKNLSEVLIIEQSETEILLEDNKNVDRKLHEELDRILKDIFAGRDFIQSLNRYYPNYYEDVILKFRNSIKSEYQDILKELNIFRVFFNKVNLSDANEQLQSKLGTFTKMLEYLGTNIFEEESIVREIDKDLYDKVSERIKSGESFYRAVYSFYESEIAQNYQKNLEDAISKSKSYKTEVYDKFVELMYQLMLKRSVFILPLYNINEFSGINFVLIDKYYFPFIFTEQDYLGKASTGQASSVNNPKEQIKKVSILGLPTFYNENYVDILLNSVKYKAVHDFLMEKSPNYSSKYNSNKPVDRLFISLLLAYIVNSILHYNASNNIRRTTVYIVTPVAHIDRISEKTSLKKKYYRIPVDQNAEYNSYVSIDNALYLDISSKSGAMDNVIYFISKQEEMLESLIPIRLEGVSSNNPVAYLSPKIGSEMKSIGGSLEQSIEDISSAGFGQLDQSNASNITLD